MSVFGFAGAIGPKELALALLMGAMAFPGAFLAKAMVEHLSVRMHTALEGHGHFTIGGSDDNIESTLPPVRSPKIVPRS